MRKLNILLSMLIGLTLYRPPHFHRQRNETFCRLSLPHSQHDYRSKKAPPNTIKNEEVKHSPFYAYHIEFVIQQPTKTQLKMNKLNILLSMLIGLTLYRPPHFHRQRNETFCRLSLPHSQHNYRSKKAPPNTIKNEEVKHSPFYAYNIEFVIQQPTKAQLKMSKLNNLLSMLIGLTLYRPPHFHRQRNETFCRLSLPHSQHDYRSKKAPPNTIKNEEVKHSPFYAYHIEFVIQQPTKTQLKMNKLNILLSMLIGLTLYRPPHFHRQRNETFCRLSLPHSQHNYRSKKAPPNTIKNEQVK